MFGIHDLPLFILSGLLLNITPGADTLYILSHSLGRGWRHGALAALGIGAGCGVHILAAALGLSALIAASATTFMLLKLVGALYLLYLGFAMLGARPETKQAEKAPAWPARKVFMQGFLTNVLNPKVALFFLAFVPQFIDPASPDKALAFLLLGFVFNFNGTLWNLSLAWSGARLRGLGHGTHRLALWLNRAVGLGFIGLGLKLALEGQGRS